MTAAETQRPAWNGLTRPEPTLPTDWYVDPGHHARELERIWYRHWIHVGRADALSEPLDFRVVSIGTQSILILRDEDGALRAFHNTCRHRGSALCTEAEGRLPAKALTCPYHNWTYDLRGALRRIPSQGRPVPIDRAEYGLYPVHLAVWRGFVFVNLSDATPEMGPMGEAEAASVGNWPLEDLVVGHRHRRVIACNWKVFWENYNECLHCPHIHPGLSGLVPIYARGIMVERDDPSWAAHGETDEPRLKGGLRRGAESWSLRGEALPHRFPRVTEAERREGTIFATALPSLYLTAHVDHVRSVTLRPLGPTETEIAAEWLFPRETLADGTDLGPTVEFAIRVMQEDGDICEIAQRGLNALPHRRGVLMPEEYDVHNFQQWVRHRMIPSGGDPV